MNTISRKLHDFRMELAEKNDFFSKTLIFVWYYLKFEIFKVYWAALFVVVVTLSLYSQIPFSWKLIYAIKVTAKIFSASICFFLVITPIISIFKKRDTTTDGDGGTTFEIFLLGVIFSFLWLEFVFHWPLS